MATPIIGRNLAGLIEEQVQSVFIPLPTAACSRNVLVLQIERALYKRRGGAITNFERSLPKPGNDLARELLKTPYNSAFLTLDDDSKERDLEDALIQHITSFLLELGQGFASLGRQ